MDLTQSSSTWVRERVAAPPQLPYSLKFLQIGQISDARGHMCSIFTKAFISLESGNVRFDRRRDRVSDRFTYWSPGL